MRKRIMVASCWGLIFLAGWTFGHEQTATHQPGGRDWKRLSSTDHKLYLSGFVNGYSMGILHASTLTLEKYAPEQVSALTFAQKKDYEDSLAWAHKVVPILSQSVSRSGIDDTVGTFYGDYRNSPVCWGDAILLSAASLSGNPATDQQLNVARKLGAESGCN
jgi:hypothetical protein